MADIGLFLVALAVVYLLPGPDMLLLLQTGARQGKAQALATALGLAMARSCHVALAALGLAVLFRTAPWTFDLVRLAGAAYLLWMGVRMLLSSGSPLARVDAREPGKPWSRLVRSAAKPNKRPRPDRQMLGFAYGSAPTYFLLRR